MNVVMALLWVATGAALLGFATTIAGRRRGAGSSGILRAGLVSLGAFFVCCFWLVILPSTP